MNHEQDAAPIRICQILIGAAYGIVGDLVGMLPIALSQLLDLISKYCDDYDLQSLTQLVVQTEQ